MARIAIGGFQHETNTFAPTKADFAAFQNPGSWPTMVTGPAMVEAVAGINLSVAGFIEQSVANGHQMVPTTWCAASPSSYVTQDAYERIVEAILIGIKNALPVEAVYLCLHGAMVAEHQEDGEGELLRRVREIVGPDMPIAVSLDLHANTTPEMIRYADILVAYRTYPHVDMADTGARTARALDRHLKGERFSKAAYRQNPYLIPLNWQCTMSEPAASVYRRLEEIETETGTLLSFTPGFPAADIHHCGPAVFGHGLGPDGAQKAQQAVTMLADYIDGYEAKFAGKVYDPDEGVKHAMELARTASKPIVIADTQDNPGAGGDSNTTGMLKALVENKAEKAAIGLIVDEDAAKIAHQAGEGAELNIALAGSDGVAGDAPFKGIFTVEKLHDGNFDATGPFYRGVHMTLGLSAQLRIGDVRIVLASKKVQLADQAMYRFVGIEPTEQNILVNKSSVHFRADFTPIAEEILVAAAPGPMVADPALLPWTRLRNGIRLNPLGAVWSGQRG